MQSTKPCRNHMQSSDWLSHRRIAPLQKCEQYIKGAGMHKGTFFAYIFGHWTPMQGNEYMVSLPSLVVLQLGLLHRVKRDHILLQSPDQLMKSSQIRFHHPLRHLNTSNTCNHLNNCGSYCTGHTVVHEAFGSNEK